MQGLSALRRHAITAFALIAASAAGCSSVIIEPPRQTQPAGAAETVLLEPAQGTAPSCRKESPSNM